MFTKMISFAGIYWKLTWKKVSSVVVKILIWNFLSFNFIWLYALYIFFTFILLNFFRSWFNSTIVTCHLKFIKFRVYSLHLIHQIFKNTVSFLGNLPFDVILLIQQFRIQIPNQLILEIVQLFCSQGFLNLLPIFLYLFWNLADL